MLKDAWYKDKNEVKVFDVIAQITDYNKTDILDRISKLEKKEPDELAYKMWMTKIYSMSKDSAEKADELIEKLNGEDVGSVSLMLIKANMYQNMGEIEKAKEVLQSEEGRHIYGMRKYDVEPVFGHLKNVFCMRRTHLRGKEKVETDIGIAFMMMNLNKYWAVFFMNSINYAF